MITLNFNEHFYLTLKESGRSCIEQAFKEQFYEKVYEISDSDISKIVEPLEKLTEQWLLDIDSKHSLGIAINNNSPFYKITSKVFESDVCVKSHSIRPVTILMYPFCNSRYIPLQKTIVLGYSANLKSLLLQWLINYEYIDATKDINQLFDNILNTTNTDHAEKGYIKSLFTKDYLITTAYHELSHWVSDVQRNNHITNVALQKKPVEKYYKVDDVIFSTMEMDAYLHGLYATKKIVGEEVWNDISFDDLFIIYPALQIIINDKNKYNVYNFKQRLFSRLRREKMLGKNMLKGFSKY